VSDLECSSFRLQQLGNFPHFFSDEERDALNKWGAHAAGLADGSIEPTTVKEKQFVEVARGTRPPATRFQRVWLRYLQAVDIQTKWRETEQNLNIVNRRLDTANNQIEQLQEDVVRLTKLWKLASDSGDTQKVDSSHHRKSSVHPASTAQECGDGQVSTLPEMLTQRFVRDVTNRDQYLQFIEKGLSGLSDNDIFVLFNMVDGLALTPQEVADFNIEHSHRAAKYQPSDGFACAAWDWRDQNEAK
jgi:uncharacterized protein YifE (UPF0438 family)